MSDRHRRRCYKFRFRPIAADGERPLMGHLIEALEYARGIVVRRELSGRILGGKNRDLRFIHADYQ